MWCMWRRACMVWQQIFVSILICWNTVYSRQCQKCLVVQHYFSIWGWYHGGQRPSSDDSFHSPTVIPPSAPSIMKHYHHCRMCSHTSPCPSPTMVTLHDTKFVECRWWNGSWTVKTVITWQSSASMILAPGYLTDADMFTHFCHQLGFFLVTFFTPPFHAVCLLVAWLLNIPATRCISGIGLLRQFTSCHTKQEAAAWT